MSAAENDDMPSDDYFDGDGSIDDVVDNVVPLASLARRGRREPRRVVEPKDGIIKLGTDVHRVVDELCDVIARDPEAYQRDGQLVRVIRTAANEADAMTLEGTPQIRSMPNATLTERLTRHGAFVRFDNRKAQWVPAAPSGTPVAALAARGQWAGVRPIVGVIEAPSMRPDGSILQTPGYDSATGFLYVPGTSFPTIPDRPTKDDAKAALEILKEPFVDVPFADEAARSVALAGVLTLLGRPAISGNVPGIIVDATTRGSGKTLTADVVSMIATGRVTSKMNWPPTDEELEKILGAYALRGALLVSFDNVVTAFGGGPLDRCLTAGGTVELRVLGKSEVPSLPWRAIVLATGNNVELRGDTARRVLVARLETDIENPEDRTGFKHYPLLPWVEKERPALVVAALTILRAYVVAGRPDVGVKSWGSFEAFSSLIPSALVFAGATDPSTARPSNDIAREPEKAALATILTELPRFIHGGSGVTVRELIETLYPPERLKGQAPPDGNGDMRDAIESLVNVQPGKPPNGQHLGKAFQRFKGRVVSGKKLVLSGADGHAKVKRWTVDGVKRVLR